MSFRPSIVAAFSFLSPTPPPLPAIPFIRSKPHGFAVKAVFAASGASLATRAPGQALSLGCFDDSRPSTASGPLYFSAIPFVGCVVSSAASERDHAAHQKEAFFGGQWRGERWRNLI